MIFQLTYEFNAEVTVLLHYRQYEIYVGCDSQPYPITGDLFMIN
jgi:hypothetical protein